MEGIYSHIKVNSTVSQLLNTRTLLQLILCKSGSQLPTEQRIDILVFLVFQQIICLSFVHTSSDGGLHCDSSHWDIRVFRNQQLHICDADRRERGE